MFKIQEIDPTIYRAKTRKATLRVVAMFLVIGFTTSFYFPKMFESDHNLLVQQIIGAFIGLMITFAIVAKFFRNQAWLAEAIYGWQLKRNLMRITNKMRKLDELVAANDHTALKIKQFYYLGITQMYTFEQNTTGLIDLKVEAEAHTQKLVDAGINPEQTEFDFKVLDQLIPTNS